MRMRILSADDKRKLRDEINKRGIPKEQIISVFQEKDGTYTAAYYEEDGTITNYEED